MTSFDCVAIYIFTTRLQDYRIYKKIKEKNTSLPAERDLSPSVHVLLSDEQLVFITCPIQSVCVRLGGAAVENECCLVRKPLSGEKVKTLKGKQPRYLNQL